MKNNSIPIKNLFYLLCYAWNVLPMKGIMKGSKDNFSNAYDLLAYVFNIGIGKVIKSGLHREYIDKEEALSSLRGKIQIQESLSQLTLIEKKLICNYDDYSFNNPLNQIIKYTLLRLIRCDEIDKKLRRELKKKFYYFKNFDVLEPTQANIKNLVFNRNNALYKLLISISIMLYTNTFVNEETGKNQFSDFYRESQMQKVFERFLLNFFMTHLDRNDYKVHVPNILWDMDEDAAAQWENWFDIDYKGPNRRTDTVIENKSTNCQYIIDAKYYKNALVKKHFNPEEETYRTNHLNQIRGYLLDSPFKGNKTGVLIYPMTTTSFNRGTMIPIRNSNIIIKTINLNEDWQIIEDDLIDFFRRIEMRR